MVKNKKVLKVVPVFLALVLSLSSLSVLAAGSRVQNWYLGSQSTIAVGKDSSHWWYVTEPVRFYGNVDKIYTQSLNGHPSDAAVNFDFYQLKTWAPDPIVGSCLVKGETVRSTHLLNCNGTYYYRIQNGYNMSTSYGTVYYS